MNNTTIDVTAGVNVSTNTLSPANILQAVVNMVGMVGNLLLLIALIQKPIDSQLTLKLLTVQSFIDLNVCLFSVIHLLEHSFWKTGVPWLDAILCTLWHNQALFWSSVAASIYNLVNLAVDRHWAILVPMGYRAREKHRFVYCISISFSALVLTVTVLYLFGFYDYETNQCLLRWKFEGPIAENMLRYFAPPWTVALYIIPSIIFITIYGRVVYKLTKQQGTTQVNQSEATASANRKIRQYTYSIVAVTIIFMSTMSVNFFSFCLAQFGLINYNQGTLLQDTGISLVSVNSGANAGVMFLVIGSFRRALLNAVKWICRSNRTGPA